MMSSPLSPRHPPSCQMKPGGPPRSIVLKERIILYSMIAVAVLVVCCSNNNGMPSVLCGLRRSPQKQVVARRSARTQAFRQPIGLPQHSSAGVIASPLPPVPNTPAHRAFRPMAHAVLRSLARRFCCARAQSFGFSLCLAVGPNCCNPSLFFCRNLQTYILFKAGFIMDKFIIPWEA